MGAVGRRQLQGTAWLLALLPSLAVAAAPPADRPIVADDGTVKRVIVPEMNLGQMNREIERYVDCPVVGLNKIGGHVFHQSEIASEALAALGRSA